MWPKAVTWPWRHVSEGAGGKSNLLIHISLSLIFICIWTTSSFSFICYMNKATFFFCNFWLQMVLCTWHMCHIFFIILFSLYFIEFIWFVLKSPSILTHIVACLCSLFSWTLQSFLVPHPSICMVCPRNFREKFLRLIFNHVIRANIGKTSYVLQDDFTRSKDGQLLPKAFCIFFSSERVSPRDSTMYFMENYSTLQTKG